MTFESKQLKDEGDMRAHIVASLNLPPIPVIVPGVAERVLHPNVNGSVSKFHRPDWDGKFGGLNQGPATIEKKLALRAILISSGLPALPAIFDDKLGSQSSAQPAVFSRGQNAEQDAIVSGTLLPLVKGSPLLFSGLFAVIGRQVSEFVTGLAVERLARLARVANRAEKKVAKKNAAANQINEATAVKNAKNIPQPVSQAVFLDKLYRETLPVLSREILEKARTDSELASALRELNDLKEKVRICRLTPENLNCGSKDLDAILKSAKVTQILHRRGLSLGR